MSSLTPHHLIDFRLIDFCHALVSGLLTLIVSCLPAGLSLAATYDHLREEGFVVVSPGGPDDGGDFGPKTPDTKTGGIQEALNHLRTINFQQHRARNLYIVSGRYDTTETIHVLWLGERFRIEARESWINYLPMTGDALVIDSQMNARLRFGYVSGLQLKEGWIVKVKPVHPGPSAPLPKERQSSVIVSTLVEVNAIVAKEYFKEGIAERGNGMLLDATVGPILWSKFDVSEVNTCGVGVQLTGACQFNTVDAWFNHGCDVHLQLDKEVSQNRIHSAINSEQVPGSIGAKIAGERNSLSLAITQVAQGKGVIFDKSAKHNLVSLNDADFGFENRSPSGGNRIVANNTLKVETPKVPASAEKLVNPFPATVEMLILDPGDVTSWALSDLAGPEQMIASPLRAGQQIRLQSGDAITLRYGNQPPKWHWRVVL